GRCLSPDIAEEQAEGRRVSVVRFKAISRYATRLRRQEPRSARGDAGRLSGRGYRVYLCDDRGIEDPVSCRCKGGGNVYGRLIGIPARTERTAGGAGGQR